MKTYKRQTIKQAFIFNFIVTLLSKFFAYLRVFSISFFLGLNRQTDVFFITFSIFNLILALRWANEILILPLFVKYRDSILKRKYLYSYFFSFSLYFGLIVFFISIVLSFIVPHFFPFSQEYKTLMRDFFLILSFSAPLVYITYTFENIFRGERRFYLFSLFYASLTVIQAIICFLGLYIYKSIYVLPIATVLAYLIVFIFIFFLERKNIKLLSIKKVLKGRFLKKLFTIYKDSYLNYVAQKLRISTDNYFGSFLKESQVSALNFAYFLNGSIYSALKLDIILMTKIAESTVFYTLLKAIFYSSLITFFVAFLIYFFSYDIVKVLFEYGHFKGKDTLLVSSLLKIAIFLLPVGTLISIFSRYYFIKDKIKLTVKVSFISVVINAILNYIFIFKFNLEAKGLILATLLSTIFALLFYMIHTSLVEEKKLINLIKLLAYLLFSIFITFIFSKILHTLLHPFVESLVTFLHSFLKSLINL